MGLMELIKGDILQITTNAADFGTAITFVAPNSLACIIYGIGIKHNLSFDEYGAPISSKTTRISISEQALVNAGYNVRNNRNEVALVGHRVTWTDVMGYAWTYRIKTNIAGETVGSIVCILEDVAPDAPVQKKIVGWRDYKITVLVRDAAGGTQTLGNGDVIPLNYVANNDGTLTIPYLNTVAGIGILAPFMVNNDPYEGITAVMGVINFSRYGSFGSGDNIEFNASLPIYLQQ